MDTILMFVFAGLLAILLANAYLLYAAVKPRVINIILMGLAGLGSMVVAFLSTAY